MTAAGFQKAQQHAVTGSRAQAGDSSDAVHLPEKHRVSPRPSESFGPPSLLSFLSSLAFESCSLGSENAGTSFTEVLGGMMSFQEFGENLL